MQEARKTWRPEYLHESERYLNEAIAPLQQALELVSAAIRLYALHEDFQITNGLLHSAIVSDMVNNRRNLTLSGKLEGIAEELGSGPIKILAG